MTGLWMSSPVEAAQGELVVFEIGGVALVHSGLVLRVVFRAEGALEETSYEEVPPLAVRAPRPYGLVVLRNAPESTSSLSIFAPCYNSIRAPACFTQVGLMMAKHSILPRLAGGGISTEHRAHG
jgi:hypothetical protein